MDTQPSIRLTHGDYTVGWVCALSKEQTAALYMLDARHDDLPNPANDHNAYYLGSISQHNVVIACLPKGMMGNNNSAVVATRMISTFPNIKIGLMVGIGGGVPPKVRLGDVVVSCASNGYPGVIQWDMGKTENDGKFRRIGSLNNPPTAILTALSKFDTDKAESRAKMLKYLDDLKIRDSNFIKPDLLRDVLYKPNYSHVKRSCSLDDEAGDAWEANLEPGEDTCELCDDDMIVNRPPRADMMIHYGLIASGNQVIKDAPFRNKLNKDFDNNLLCIEMEAAGLMNDFPCIVIRGICDYADSHKNKAWQEYAAATAAACAKSLLTVLPVSDTNRMQTIKDFLPPSFIESARNFISPLWGDYRKGFTETPGQVNNTTEENTNPLPGDVTQEQSQPKFISQDNGNELGSKHASADTHQTSSLPERRESSLERRDKSDSTAQEGRHGTPLPQHYSHQHRDSGVSWKNDYELHDLDHRDERSTPVSPYQRIPPEARDTLANVEPPSREFRKFDLTRISIQLLEDIGRNEREEQFLTRSITKKSHHSTELKAERQKVEEELKKLEAKRRAIIAEEEVENNEIRYLKQRHQDVERKQGQAFTQWASTQEQLDELLHIENINKRKNEYDLANIRNLTPFQWATENSHLEMVELLLNEGAEAAIKSESGWNPLIIASQRGHVGVVRLLLDTKRFDIDLKDDNKLTALHWAVMNGHGNVVQLLVERGANMDCRSTLKDHTEAVLSVAFSPNSKLIASGASDNTVRLWDPMTGRCVQILRGHTDHVFSVAFSPDSKLLASSSADKSIAIWNLATYQCVETFAANGQVFKVAFSHDSKLFASACSDSTIQLMDLAKFRSRELRGHTEYVSAVTFSHNSKLLASASSDMTIKLWDMATRQCLQTLNGHTDRVHDVTFSHDSKVVASAAWDHTVKLWDVTTGQCQQTLNGHTDIVTSVVFLLNSTILASASTDATIKLWDLVTGQCLQTLSGHKSDICGLAASHDSRLLASSSRDETIKLWDTSASMLLACGKRGKTE